MAADGTIVEQLEETFQRATQAYVRSVLTSERDLAEFETIVLGAEQKRDDLNRLYHEEYEARVEAARARLYDEKAQASFDHPAPFGARPDRNAAITSAAQTQVRLAHQSDLRETRRDAHLAIEDLFDRARRRDQVRGMSSEAFARVHDRRSGQDRRSPKQSQD